MTTDLTPKSRTPWRSILNCCRPLTLKLTEGVTARLDEARKENGGLSVEMESAHERRAILPAELHDARKVAGEVRGELRSKISFIEVEPLEAEKNDSSKASEVNIPQVGGGDGDGSDGGVDICRRRAVAGGAAFVELLTGGSDEAPRAAGASEPAAFQNEGIDKTMLQIARPLISREVSESSARRIKAWHRKYAWRQSLALRLRTRQEAWLCSFFRRDPRWQIMTFFNEVAREGGEVQAEERETESGDQKSPLVNLFDKADVFTVWRPNSDPGRRYNGAVKNMILGIATGKGMEIKGKSARSGNITSYVPFIQIYEDAHIKKCQSFLKSGHAIRLFYQSDEARNEAYKIMRDIKCVMHGDPDLRIVNICIHSSPPVFGLDIDEDLFWETYVISRDCFRPAGTDWDTGRPSEPQYMGKNLEAARLVPAPGERRVVVYQKNRLDPLEPRTLIMAYEQNGEMKPVVSDFDCFLLGSRGVKYKNPISENQVKVLKWTVKHIGQVLYERSISNSSKENWTQSWLKVHEKAIKEGYQYPKMPPYGFGDPKSYEIFEAAVSRLTSNGCVRHGAECFNWFIPGEMEDELLVISNCFPGIVKWKTMNVPELQDWLVSKIEKGFTFPINPKWVLCDPGWRRVYDKLLASQEPNVQDSINCWLPPGTGLREEIDEISSHHPSGFGGVYEKAKGRKRADTIRMPLVLDKLENLKVGREWEKSLAASPVLRRVWFWIRLMRMKRRAMVKKMDKNQRSIIRKLSWRSSSSASKISKWHKRDKWKKLLESLLCTRREAWLRSFCRSDPRRQILNFFDQVAREEAEVEDDFAESQLINHDAHVFTVWRPIANEAIKNMILGVATGKGLNIKGKSARRGNISSFVPFIQVHEEAHKEECRTFLKSGGAVRVYFRSATAREEAYEIILQTKKVVEESNKSAKLDRQEKKTAHAVHNDPNLRADFVNTYIHSSPPLFGLDINEVLFWETYVINQDCSRPAGTQWDTGRTSNPAFMDMNLNTIRLFKGHAPKPGEPRAVVYQWSKYSPLEPRTLLIAYEQYPSVKPVVSDFDCFLLGSRGIKYKGPIPHDQMKVLKWMVKHIDEILDQRSMPNFSKTGWMETWFKVLKTSIEEGSRPTVTTQAGWFGDPKSTEIARAAASRLKSGCVRHGAECFNWFFPQEIDDELLVISSKLPGNKNWKMMNVSELQDFLVLKIEEGFTFPINPKWVLCDPGWRGVYKKLLASQEPHVQHSINCWLPPGTGLREEIDAISSRHSSGFEGTYEEGIDVGRMPLVRTERMEEKRFLMANSLKNLKSQVRWKKVRHLLVWFMYVRIKSRVMRQEREEGDMNAVL